MKKQISTSLTDSNIQGVLHLLAETPERLAELGHGLSDEHRRMPLGPGERSFQEVVAHLLNGDDRAVEAITLALLQKEPLVHRIHPERDLGKLLRFDLQPYPDLLAYFRLRRRVLLRVLSSLTERQWARTIRQEGKKREESVYWQTRGLALHEGEHLQDLEERLGKARGAG